VISDTILAEEPTNWVHDHAAIVVEGLIKSYGASLAVHGIDLTVNRGEVFALLGPNGAGKTTTVEILEGFRRRDGGRVTVLGFDPATGERAFKARIGIVLQSTGIDPYLTVAETIALLGAPYPRRLPVDQVLMLVELQVQRNARVNTLSGGQRRRLDLAVALVGDPDLLFLDEPTTGFDPAARRHAWAVVKRLADLGKTIFLTTHYMEEAQYLADRVAIMVGGEIVATGSPAALIRDRAGETVVTFRLPSGVSNPPTEIPGHLKEREGAWTLTTDEPTSTLHALTGWALSQGIRIEALSVSQPSLEDVYLTLAPGTGNTEERR